MHSKTWASAAGAVLLPWIFIHNTDKVEGSLMALFFGLVFFFQFTPLPLEIFLPMPLIRN